jgi:ABC-type microcin C transport system permease subunit YejB
LVSTITGTVGTAIKYSRRLFIHILLIGIFCWKTLTDLFCYRVLWKTTKDELQDTKENTDVTFHLAYAIAATIVTVKYIAIAFHMKLCSEVLFHQNI